MTMGLIEKTKSYYRAYERHDPDYVAGELAEGFTFTSPFDDHIGREEYFRRCWPTEPLHQKFDFVSVAQDGDRVLVVYDCTLRRPNAVHPDMTFRNAEMQTFENGKLKSVEVFFGDPPNGLTRRQFAVQCGAG
jgi:predicted SnoaL-like aldol condensation-catalyzing enzyme